MVSLSTQEDGGRGVADEDAKASSPGLEVGSILKSKDEAAASHLSQPPKSYCRVTSEKWKMFHVDSLASIALPTLLLPPAAWIQVKLSCMQSLLYR